MPVPTLLVQRLGPASRRAADLLLAAAAGLLCGYAAAETPPIVVPEPAWLSVLVAAGAGVPVLLRRRWPAAAAVTVGVLAGVLLATGVVPDYAMPALVAVVALTLYTVGRLVPGRRGAVIAAVATAPLLAGPAVTLVAGTRSGVSGDAPGPAGFGFAVLVCGAAWAVGWTLRERRRHAETTAAESTARAVTEERLRIAREMHDVVGHSLSLITVQASVAHHVAQQRPEAAVAALAVIEEAGRGALAELRRAVGALRTEPDFGVPPTLGDLGRLTEQARAAGVEVRLDVRGGEQLPEGVALAAYRIVQESLTNVVRHAAPAACHVDIEGAEGQLRIEVSDDGTRRPPPAADGAGLAGMRERVAAFGGTFSAGPRAGGGFAVVATLPFAGTS